MKCTNYGHDNDGLNKFCSNCGHILSEPAQSSTSTVQNTDQSTLEGNHEPSKTDLVSPTPATSTQSPKLMEIEPTPSSTPSAQSKIALVLGIISIILAPLFSWIAVIPAVIGLILCLTDKNPTKRRKTSLILNVIGLVLGVLLTWFYLSVTTLPFLGDGFSWDIDVHDWQVRHRDIAGNNVQVLQYQKNQDVFVQPGIVDDASNIFPCDEDYADETCQLAIYLQLRWSAESATGETPLVDGSGGFTEVAPGLHYAYYRYNPELVSNGADKVYFVLDSSQQKMLLFVTYLGEQTALQSEFDEAVVRLITSTKFRTL